MVAALLASHMTASAQSSASVPAEVETVATGGYWVLDDSTRGTFRVVIETGGFEHIISDAHIDWIAEPTESDTPPRIVASTDIPDVTNGGVHLMNPVFSRDGKQWILTIEAVNTHCDPARVDRWRVALGAPGKLAVLGSTPLEPGCE